MRILLLLLSLLPTLLSGQRQYPQDLANPLSIPLVLAGDFGELRPNHFHAGIDIKTQGKEGLKVYSVSEGYVSRIKVSTSGYGKVLYIIHPNGFESVYAHLKNFAPKIEKIVKAEQYKKQEFEIEIKPKANEITVSKGEWIALSGNTGRSYAPHLHFEMRDAISSRPLNPLLFGYKIADNIPPKIHKLFAYPVGGGSVINGSVKPIEVTITQSKGKYVANAINALGTIGFGIQADDYQDDTKNKFGVYKVLVKLNGSPILACKFDELNFNENAYINTLIDYSHYVRNKERIQRLYRTPSNRLSIYEFLKGEGLVNVEEGFSYVMEVFLEDFSGNKTELTIPINGVKMNFSPDDFHQKGCLLTPIKDYVYQEGNHKIYVPQEALYDEAWLQMSASADTLRIYPTDIPLKKNFEITMQGENISTERLKYTAIARIDEKTQKPTFLTTKFKGSNFVTRTKQLGTFVLLQDTIAPVAKLISPSKGHITDTTIVKIRVTDQGTGLSTYKATLNGKWVLMEYEPKDNLLFFNVKDVAPLSEGKQVLKLKIGDRIGNETTVEYLFQKNNLKKK